MQALSHTKAFWKYFIKFRHENVDDETGIMAVAAVAVVQKTIAALVIMMIVMTLQRGRRTAQQVEATTSPKLHILPLRGSRARSAMSTQIARKTKKGTTVSLCYEIHSLLRVLWSGRWVL